MGPKNAALALGDQAAVSAGNFLVIAFGAWMLALPEQTKLVYAFTAYIAAVLFNASAFFSPAPVLRHEVDDLATYRNVLFRAHVGTSVVMAAVLLSILVMAGPYLEWVPTWTEMLWAGCFLVFQQWADFQRRSGYVFGSIHSAAVLSVTVLVLRVGMLLSLRPERAETFFAVLALSALPAALVALVRARPEVRWTKGENKGMLSRHFKLARWNILNAPLQWMGLHLPILLAGLMAGAGAAAIVASVRSLSTAANVFLELLETYVPAWMVSRARQDGHTGIQMVTGRLYFWGGAVWLVVAGGILFFGEPLLGMALGRTYAPYGWVLLLLWIGNGIYFAARVFGVRQRVIKRTSVELAGSLGGILTLAAAWPLMERYGALGVAVVLALVQLGGAVTQLLYTRRLRRADNRPRTDVEATE